MKKELEQKKVYILPDFEVVLLRNVNVITSSDPEPGDWENPPIVFNTVWN